MTSIVPVFIILLALLQGAPPVSFSALWDGPGAATISWYQEARGCLAVEHATGEAVFIGCYDRYPATLRIELGHGLTDGTVRPQVGDVYVLVTNDQTYRALLVARQWRVYVSTIRR